MPQIGFGTWQARDDECRDAVLTALLAGVRHIDTASVYKNESAVGLAIKMSKIPREDIFITSKLYPADAGEPSKVVQACKASIERLGVDKLDLYLVHWPAVSGKPPEWDGHAKARGQTWTGMQQVLEAGLVRCIGVSNWLPAHLDELAKGEHLPGGKPPAVFPMVNQFELHPLLQQKEVQAACARHDVLASPYCPLARADARLFEAGPVAAAAESHCRTPAQIALRWAIQKGFPCIPKSVTRSRIRENCSPGLLDFELTKEEIESIDGLELPDGTGRMCWDPSCVA